MRRRSAAVKFLGRRRYAPVHELQARVQEARAAAEAGDLVLLVEHEAVVTLGRGAKSAHVLLSAEALGARGIDLAPTGRGGDVTFHGPGQLVGYPILDLKPDRCDLRRYVRCLAEIMILVARDHHVEAGVVDGLVGVWTDADKPDEWAGAPWARRLAKLGAIGVRVSRWVTMHGFALNLAIDPSAFDVIVPCGIREHSVASIASLTGRRPAVRDVALAIGPHLERALDLAVGAVEDLSSVPDGELAAAVLGAPIRARTAVV